MLVSIVIPCSNSQETIGKVVEMAMEEFRTLKDYDCEDVYKRQMYKSRKVIAKDGNIYYAGSNGWCCNFGFKTITEDGKKNTYYFGKNAKAYKGWHTINGKKYYFYKGNTQGSAVMARNITLTSGSGVVSVFNKNGVCIKQYKK